MCQTRRRSWGSRSQRTNSGSFTIPCIVPDLRDGNIGGVKIIQDEDFYRTIEPIYITATGVHTNSNGEYVYNYYTVRPFAASARTNAWLRAHGVTVQTLGELNNVELNGSTDVNGLAG